MIGLTTAQAELLFFIKRHMEQHDNVAPSFEEMKQYLGLKSKSGVHRLITALEERGHLVRIHNRARAMEVLDQSQAPDPLDRFTTPQLIAELARRGEYNRRAA